MHGTISDGSGAPASQECAASLGDERSGWRAFTPSMGLPPYMHDRINNCYHEAGHAIVSAYCGVPVETGLVSADGLSGYVRSGKCDATQPDQNILAAVPHGVRQRIEQEAALIVSAIWYAGWQAEFVYQGVLSTGYTNLHDHDHVNGRQALQRVFDDFPAAALASQMIARRILERSWTAVRDLAEHMNRGDAIDNDDVLGAYSSADPPRWEEVLRGVPERIFRRVG